MTTPGLYLIWTNNVTLIGLDSDGKFVEGPAVHGVTFPGEQTRPIFLKLSTSARDNSTFDTFRNIRLYLTGSEEQVAVVQEVWPTQDGGIQISYDGGRTYNTFTTTYGYESDSSTWVLLPGVSITNGGVDGVLGAFDSANLIIRYVIPKLANQFDIYNVSITAAFEVQ